jgi:adenine phosphoribosyltransferase
LELSAALALVRDVADYPTAGVVFKDIAPLLADHAAFAATVSAMAAEGSRLAEGTVDAVVGIEARGFILAAPVALALGAGFVPVRKPGKLPGATYDVSYTLEYGAGTLAPAARRVRAPGARVPVVDDVLSTGGASPHREHVAGAAPSWSCVRADGASPSCRPRAVGTCRSAGAWRRTMSDSTARAP